MAEMLGSAVAQEVVSGAFSFMRNNHEEMAAQTHLMERLKLAHLNLKFKLERTKRMPIIEVSLLELRIMMKHVFEESRDLLYKQHTQQVNLEEQGVMQRVPPSPSLPNRLMHAVKPFFGTEKGSISESCVRRFELFAEKTDKFVRDVESGFSLALYRFSRPLITQLLEGKYVRYRMVSGSQTRSLSIYPCCVEDYGVVAYLIFMFKDLKTPMKSFNLHLTLRLSESTDIVGICIKCLQSLKPRFESESDVVSGELAQVSTQVGFIQPEPDSQNFVFEATADTSTWYRQEPLCCIGDGFKPLPKNVISSHYTERFPEQVILFGLDCYVSVPEYNCLSRIGESETDRNTPKACPIVGLVVAIAPHFMSNFQDGNEFCGPSDCSNFTITSMLVPVKGVVSFVNQPERTKYVTCIRTPHGCAVFIVSKLTSGLWCAPKIGDGSKTRRMSKRKR